MSARALWAHNDGDCDSWSCHYCRAEEERETPITLTADGIEIPAPLDTDVDEDEDDVPNPVDASRPGDPTP